MCGVIIEPSPQQKEKKKKKMISRLMETSDVKEKSEIMAKLGPIVHEEIMSKIKITRYQKLRKVMTGFISFPQLT